MTPAERLHAIALLRQNAIDYWYRVDHEGGAGVSEMFVEDGVFHAGPGEPLVGRAAIEAFYAWRRERGERTSRHIITNFHAAFDGERFAEVAPAVVALGTKLVIDHFGWHDPAARLAEPSYQAMLRLLERTNVWVKLSSGFRRPDADLPGEYAQDLLRRFGPDKLLWGSDAPFVGHEDAIDYPGTVALFRRWVPDELERRAIGENGYRFYFESAS